MTKEEFIQTFTSYIQPLYPTYRILPSLGTAQPAQETGFGEHAPGNNYHGIKWKPPYKKQFLWTKEWNPITKQYEKKKLAFCLFDTPQQSIQVYLADIMQLPRYAIVRQATNYKDACIAVSKAGYATSPVYANSLIKLIEKYRLYEYDPSGQFIIDQDKQFTEHFWYKELDSPDIPLTFPPEIFNNLMIVCALMENLRRLAGNRPVLVFSGYRTPYWNKKVGGVLKSQHLLGKAIDCKIEGMPVMELAALGRLVGFKGIGVYRPERFVHLDIRERAASWYG